MITVRPVRPDEHEAVGALTLAAYDLLGRVGDDYRVTITDVAGRIDAESTVLVAVEDDTVLGSVTVVSGCSRHFEHVGAGDGGFRMLAVDPAAQGRGVGRLLLEACLTHGREAGWHRMVITSMAWMPAAQAMYVRRGFTRRADLDVRFESGVGNGFAIDLTQDAATRFPPPGPVPDEPPPFAPRHRHHTSC